ncbi:MAG: PD-(D/E)XK nuclease family protein [Polyangia bacterium]
MSTALRKYTVERREEPSGARHYVTPLGTLPSVTTILKGSTSWGFYQRTSVHAAQARRRGHDFHEDMAAFLEQGRPSSSAHFPSVLSFLRRLGSVRLVEGHVWHRDGFAGAVDCVAEVDGVLSVIDWKTSTEPRSPGAFDAAQMQVAAYRAAVQSLYGIDIPRGFVVVALPRGDAQVLPTENLDGEYEGFLARLARFRARPVRSRAWVGR